MKRSRFFWPRAVWALLTRRGKFVRQTARTDCGVACALTVLNMLGRPVDPVAAVETLDADRTGTSLDGLRRYLEQEHGLSATSLAVPARHVGSLGGQVILHMRQMHYVVLLAASDRGVLVFDPAMGPVLYPPADFAALYSGHALEVVKPRRAGTLPAVASGHGIVGGTPRRGLEPVSLFVIGAATRLLECALLLCLVAVLYLLLNHASFSSMLLSILVMAACGGLLLMARQIRFDGEDGWARRKQSKVWRGLLRTSFRGRDLNGFRGRMERDVSGNLRQGLSVSIPRRAQVPATIGAFMTMPVLLVLLSPVVAMVHLLIFGTALVASQLDTVQVCRRSVRGDVGRYSTLRSQSYVLSYIAPAEVLGEVAKWTVIGFAGFAVLFGALPPVALMFWILAAMQIVPIDFRAVARFAPALAMRTAVSDLTATEVPLRRQRILGPADLTVSRGDGLLRVDGLAALTQSLQQPDLTVREQRLIMADIVRVAFETLPDALGPSAGPIRIFGPGQDATQADFEYLMIAREARSGQTLPVPRAGRQAIDKGLQDPVLRDLHSCDPGDLPVFWDFRNKMPVGDLRARLSEAGMPHAAHMTMKRLTLVEAA